MKQKVRELVADNPNFIYSVDPYGSCFYDPVIDDQPGCIFGQSLIALGVTINPMWEGNDINEVLDKIGISRTENQYRWAGTLQEKQDEGDSWSIALREADNR